MNYLYNQSYSRPEWAKTHFKNMPAHIRRRMAETHFTAAENKCPLHLPIGRLMRRAPEDFA